MDMQDIKVFADYGILGLFAYVLFYFYRKDVKTYVELWKGQSDILLQTVRDNTVELAALRHLLEEITGRYLGRPQDKDRDRRAP